MKCASGDEHVACLLQMETEISRLQDVQRRMTVQILRLAALVASLSGVTREALDAELDPLRDRGLIPP